MTAKVPVRNPWVSAEPAPSAPESLAPPPPAPPTLAPSTDGGGVLTAARARSKRKEPLQKDPGRRPFTIYLDPSDFALLEAERQRRAISSDRRRGYAEYSAIIAASLRDFLSRHG